MIKIIFVNFIAILFVFGGIFGLLDSDNKTKQIALLRFPVAYLLFVHSSQLAKSRSKDLWGSDD
jgi:hypothetical protein